MKKLLLSETAYSPNRVEMDAITVSFDEHRNMIEVAVRGGAAVFRSSRAAIRARTPRR
jgi:hypothetical protein